MQLGHDDLAEASRAETCVQGRVARLFILGALKDNLLWVNTIVCTAYTQGSIPNGYVEIRLYTNLAGCLPISTPRKEVCARMIYWRRLGILERRVVQVERSVPFKVL